MGLRSRVPELSKDSGQSARWREVEMAVPDAGVPGFPELLPGSSARGRVFSIANNSLWHDMSWPHAFLAPRSGERVVVCPAPLPRAARRQ